MFNQLQKATVVAKLRGAHERKRRQMCGCVRRKPALEAATAMAKELHSQRLPLRAIG